MGEIDGAEPVDGGLQSVSECHLRLPAQFLLRQGDVGAASGWIVCGQRLLDEFYVGAGHFDNQFRQLANGEFTGVADIHRSHEIIGAIHHGDHAFDQVITIAEGARLTAIAKDGDILTGQRLSDEVRNNASIVGMHPRSVGIENPHDPNVDFVHAMIIHEQCLGRAFAFVVASPRSQCVYIAMIALRLRMNFGVTVNLGSTGLQDLCTAAFGHSQHVDRTNHTGLDRFDGIELIVSWRGRASQVVNFIDFQMNWAYDIMPD